MKILTFKLFLLLFISGSCAIEEVQNIEKSRVNFEQFNYNPDSLVLFNYRNSYKETSPIKGSDTIEWRGIDSYTCWSRDSVLEIDFNYGFLTSGQSLNLKITKDTVTPFLVNWSDGSLGEAFRYDIVEFAFTLNDRNYLSSDTIVGKISIKGIQNIDETKEELILVHDIKNWQEFEKSYKKKEVTLSGQFKLTKVKYYSDGGQSELSRMKIYNDKTNKTIN
jgi:hypothetical protein